MVSATSKSLELGSGPDGGMGDSEQGIPAFEVLRRTFAHTLVFTFAYLSYYEPAHHEHYPTSPSELPGIRLMSSPTELIWFAAPSE